MKLHNLKRVPNYMVREWLIESIPEITPYQKDKIRSNEIIEDSPFYFFEDKKLVKNKMVRISIIFLPVAWIILVIGLIPTFIITGKWGYNRLGWFNKWVHALGL